MKAVFADTYFFLALLDSKEPRHLDAVAASRDQNLILVTTDCVLIEFGDAYCDPRDRGDFIAMYQGLVGNPRVRIIATERRLFERGVELFEQRPDKKWSLTDCVSFVVMTDEGILEVLTGDHDFEQAGFKVLLK